MAPHHVPFLGVQLALFKENCVRNGDLADVVEIAAAIERRQVLTWQPQRLAQHHRCHRQPLAMFSGVLIAMLNSLRQRQQNSFGLFQRIDQALIAQHRAHPRAHYGGMQRLDQKLVGAR